MRSTAVIFTLALIVSCKDTTEKLEPYTQTLDLQRVAFACECADWVKPADFDRPGWEDSTIFIEPADSSLILPDTLGYNSDLIRFTGQFYQEKGYPKGYRSEQDPSKAKVFRYTKFQVLRSNYNESRVLPGE